MSSKEFQPPRGGTIVSMLTRCVACRRWWSLPEPDLRWINDGVGVLVNTCACGGLLEIVDMAKHLASLPVAKKETR